MGGYRGRVGIFNKDSCEYSFGGKTMEQSVLDVYDNPGEFFKDLATKVHKRDSIVTGVQDDGFVLKHSLGKVIFAGYREDDKTYVVGKM
jgi:hypothetical protein